MSDKYAQPHPVSDVQVVFPANLGELLPPYEDIPEDFRRERGDARQWIDFQRQWMFRGVSKAALTPRPDVDVDAALRHLKVIQGSFEPKHEHKEAAVAWLASRWFESYTAVS
jgi:hypothetical protein